MPIEVRWLIWIQICDVSCQKPSKTSFRERWNMRSSISIQQSAPWVTYLNLFVVTNGFYGRRASQGGVCAAWAKLDHTLGPAHQTGHSAPVLNQLLLLLLREISWHMQWLYAWVSQSDTISLSIIHKTPASRGETHNLSNHVKWLTPFSDCGNARNDY